VKAALALAAAALLSVAAMGGLVAWQHAHPGAYERELAWIESYIQWRAEIDRALRGGDTESALDCEGRLLDLTGRASTATLEAVQEAALGGCRSLRNEIYAAGAELDGRVYDDWHATRYRILGKMMDVRGEEAHVEESSRLAAVVAPYAGTTPVVLCWPGSDWDELSEEVRLVRGGDFRLAGYADWTRDRIHLAPRVCDPLKRFFGGNYSPNLNLQSYELAESLATLAHEGEHLRSPDATEAEVECVALQRVRDLVRGAGRSQSYGNLMAGLAWNVGYPANLSEYKTNVCRNGGPLDLRPQSDVWP
jgi:hypothetical protein